MSCGENFKIYWSLWRLLYQPARKVEIGQLMLMGWVESDFFQDFVVVVSKNAFLRPDSAIRTNLGFLGAWWAIRTKFDNFRECLLWSEHIGANFGNFIRIYCPKFWKISSGLLTYNRGSCTRLLLVYHLACYEPRRETTKCNNAR